ncbi:unnamed protein product [Durusdinium trenchii]|uniref:PX domain-containing protein n=1 Tax=Durusdinium trenchii TaxID=1381693 RepID=A0ABP0RCV2_9DINO
MTTLADLSAHVYKAGPTWDHSTYQYHIQLKYGEASWEVAKRFSDFDALLQSLATNRFGGLPKLPAKTLLGSPMDQAAIDARKEQLRILLQDLLLRPDTRTCAAMRQFLDLPGHVDEEIRQVQPTPVRSFEDPRFGVSGVCVSPEANLVMVTHEDSTHLSRLGRVWSVVEPDELGALHLWARAGDGTWRRSFSQTYGIKVRSLCWEPETRQIFVGLEDGKIEVFHLKPGEVKPEAAGALELHHKSPVTHLSVSSRRTRELRCGGRLLKRLRSEMDYLTSCHLDDEHDRAFIGTSGGDVFVLDISQNPPNFLHMVDMGSKPVCDMALTQEHFLVAHSDCIAALTVAPRGEESRMARLGNYRVKHLHESEVSILSVTVAVQRDLVFGGYSDGSIAVWSMRATEAVLVLQGHQCDVTRLVWLEEPTWGPVLYSGGGDGKVTTWNLNGNAEDFALWAPASGLNLLDRGSNLAPQDNDAALSAFEPSFDAAPAMMGGYSDPFTLGESRRVNPQALKTEESDSDNELVDAFH